MPGNSRLAYLEAWLAEEYLGPSLSLCVLGNCFGRRRRGLSRLMRDGIGIRTAEHTDYMTQVESGRHEILTTPFFFGRRGF